LEKLLKQKRKKELMELTVDYFFDVSSKMIFRIAQYQILVLLGRGRE
jgi:hypothetical protein